jgi:predicted glycosyltransferase
MLVRVRLLVDILHPAHVHFFRHLHGELIARGHEVTVTSRDKDMTVSLLNDFGIPHTVLSRQGKGALGLARELAVRTARLDRVAARLRPDAMLGVMGPAIAPIGRLRGIPTFVFYDTETATATNPWVFRLARYVCVPEGFECPVPARYLRYSGTQELAYLHPARFTPDPKRLIAFGVEPDEPYTLVRFVSWEASHDVGDRGLTGRAKMLLLEQLEQHGRVLLSTEGAPQQGLPGEPLTGPVADIHHVLAYSLGIVGDSGTMSLEAAALGRPAVYVSTSDLSVIHWVERTTGLIRQIDPADESVALAAATAWGDSAVRAELRDRHSEFVADAEDVTDWMCRLLARALPA